LLVDKGRLPAIAAGVKAVPVTVARQTARIDPLPGKVQGKVMLVFKIFRRAEWDAFRMAGETKGAPVDLADGYIHMSTAQQVAETAARHFADESNLVLVALDDQRLGSDLRWEPSRGGQLFPHLYRPLKIADVVWDKSLPLGATGHIFPEGLL
jgi:uncharacterized protein (DUF952 family)